MTAEAQKKEIYLDLLRDQSDLSFKHLMRITGYSFKLYPEGKKSKKPSTVLKEGLRKPYR